ncbi:MAG: HEAT repeat domain-containing protein [Gemmatimonadaceae bacterium]|nr:HEAT repeat domain-containing protein [Gemmatimonadaceae bacterium]
MTIRFSLLPLLFVVPTLVEAQQAPSTPRAPLAPSAPLATFAQTLASAPRAWGSDARYPQDPADSLYREARTLLNRGEWRKSATLFAQVASRTPASAYAADALYWQAFALYRIGGMQELRDGLAALDARKARFPRAGNADEAESLGTRIVGALAQRGDASAQTRLRSQATAAASACDSEELSVRSSALSTLMRNNPEAAGPLLVRVLERRDECSVSLRKSAVMMIGTKGDAASKAKLGDVAKSDPSESVRSDAISYLARISGDEVVATLDAVIRNDQSLSVQRAAVRALGSHESAKANAAIRALVERSSAPEQLRLDAIGTFDDGTPLSFACAGNCNVTSLEAQRYLEAARSEQFRSGGQSVSGFPTPVAAPVPMAAPVPPVPAVAPVAPVRTIPGQAVYTTSPGGVAYTLSADSIRYVTNSRGSKSISPEDAAWLRSVFPRLETARLKSRAITVLARAKDEATMTWLMGIITREEESSDVRASILSRMGNDLPIAQLGRLYDGAATRQVREQIVYVLGRRKEPEATDKLIEIVRTGTDPQLRRSAISALTSKKDPRTTQLLLELVDR